MKAQFLGLAFISFLGAAAGAPAQDTTAAAPLDTSYAEYRESPISLPLGIGLRVPSYDRVNGLTLPWGPKIETGNGRVDVDLLVSYRSNLGDWDPSLEGTLRPGDENELAFFVGQGTFTNESWIRGDLSNSVVAFFAGSDARNYYRARRGTARFTRSILGSTATLDPFIGINFERDWSTGMVTPSKSPWSVFGRKSDQRMRRPNPRVAKGTITSVLGGAGLEFVRSGVDGKINLTFERALRTRLESDCAGVPITFPCFGPGERFTQGTLDARVMIPTFRTQTLTVRAHSVHTFAGVLAPPQRFAYMGGTGTLATVDLLAVGGDHLLFFDGDYIIPIERIQLPILGSPFLAFRYAAGNAGVNGLPDLIQNLGVGLGLTMLRIDFSIDPARDRSVFSRRSAVSVGLNLSL